MLKFVPLVVFLVMAGFLWRGLSLDPREVPSPLIGKPAPAFAVQTVPVGGQSATPFQSADMRGQVWVLNVFASWCVACIAEHQVLTRLARTRPVAVLGLNYKDSPSDADGWLRRFGNPYTATLDDRDGMVGLDWGVYGVPETFIMDAEGNVRYKHIGPIDDAALDTVVLPLIDELMGAPS